MPAATVNSIELLLGIIHLVVGFNFFCIAWALLGKSGTKDVGILNLVVGIFVALSAWWIHSLGLTAATALCLVFAMIYFMVFGVFVFGYDSRGLGWFCLFATIVFIWYAYHFATLGPVAPQLYWYTFFNLAWAVLTFVLWLALSLGKPLAKLAAYILIIESFITTLIPAMLFLTEKWNPLAPFIAG